MSKQKPSRRPAERNTPEHVRRRQTIAVVKGCRAAIEAYVTNVQRDADRTLAILDRVLAWAESGGPMPTFLQQYRDAHRLTYRRGADEPSSHAHTTAEAVIESYESSLSIFAASLYACLGHATGVTRDSIEVTATGLKGSIRETVEESPIAEDVTAALETALNAA